MGRHKRIRRTLAIRVSEPQPANPNETWTPGLRFATGWQLWHTGGAVADCRGDPIKVAGFLAAKGACDAHHYAINHIEP